MINSTNDNSAFKPTFCSNFENLVEMGQTTPKVQKAIRIAQKDISKFIGDDSVCFTLEDGKKGIEGLEIKGFQLTCKMQRPPATGFKKFKNVFFKYLASFTNGKQIIKQNEPEEVVLKKFLLSSTQWKDYFDSAYNQYTQGLKKIYNYKY